MNAIMAIKEVYEARIADVKEHMSSLKKDKLYLAIAVCVLGGALVLFLLVDLLVGSIGWIRY